MLLALSLLALQESPIVLTRGQAEQMAPKELESLLLADFPHGHINNVRILKSEESPQPLQAIFFEEDGQASGGYFCTARRITVIFDTVHGRLPEGKSDLQPNARRRRFNVHAAPLLAVLGEPATDEACATVRKFAQMAVPEAALSRGRWYVEAVHALSRDAANNKLRLPVTCVDETANPDAACDGERALATLEWRNLANVELPSASRGPTTQLQFWASRNWHVEVTGTARIESVTMRRVHPAPF